MRGMVQTPTERDQLDPGSGDYRISGQEAEKIALNDFRLCSWSLQGLWISGLMFPDWHVREFASTESSLPALPLSIRFAMQKLCLC